MEGGTIGILERFRRGRAVKTNTRSESANRIASLLASYDYGSDAQITNPYEQSIAVFRCVNVVADSLARAPLTVFDGEEPVPSSPLQVLLNRPNDIQRQSHFIKTIVANLLLDGNAYVFLGQPNSHGVPCSMYPFPPDRIRAIREKRDLYSLDGYALQMGPGKEQFIPRDRMIHLQYAPSPRDPTIGVGPLGVARLAVEQDHLATVWNKAVLKNSGSPAGVLRWKGEGVFDEDDAELVKNRWEETYAGTEQAESIAVLGGNFEFQSIGNNARDMQFLEARRWNLGDIARAFNVPLLFLNEYETSGLSDAGLKVQAELLYRSNVIPLGHDNAQAFTESLCVGFDPTRRIKHDFSQVEALRDDETAKIELAKGLKELGYPINAINKKLGMGMEDVDHGDVVLVPAGTVPVDDLLVTSGAEADYAEEFAGGGDEPTTDVIGVDPAGDGDVNDVDTHVDTVDVTGTLTFNGAQIKAVIDVVTQVGEGTLPYDSAKGILQVVFGFTPDEAAAILGSAKAPDGDVMDAESSLVAGLPAPDTIRVKYKGKDIDTKPTDAMAAEARRGLKWRAENNGNGGTAVGVARARDISNRKNLSPETVRRMHSFFSRHEVDKSAKGFKPGEDGFPSRGRIAWALWGGDAGQSWARARVKQMDAADNRGVRLRLLTQSELRSATGLAPVALVFDREMWSPEEARGWIQRQSYAMGEPQFTPNAIRFASTENAMPDFVDNSFRKASMDDGVVGVLGRIKADYIGPDGMWALPEHRRRDWEKRVAPMKKPERAIERHVKREFNTWRNAVLRKIETETARVGDPDPSSNDDTEGE